LSTTLRSTAFRSTLNTQQQRGAKIVCALYPDPVAGYPPKYARDSIPTITKYPDGQTTPTPSAIDFKPGQLLGCVRWIRPAKVAGEPGP